MTKNPILVALDFDNLPEALRLVEQVHDLVGGFKVGLQLCNNVGTRQVIDAVSEAGGQLFVDLKFKDVPNTVAGAVRAIARPGVMMFNVHCDGGVEMMRRAVEVSRASEQGPLVLGVTVLTSIDETILHDELLIPSTLTEQVVHFAKIGQAAGLDGVVCSAYEVAAVKAACGEFFLTVVPGVRPKWAEDNDQRRVMTPGEAASVGTDYLVVGRPITRPPASIGTPADAARRIVEEIQEAREGQRVS